MKIAVFGATGGIGKLVVKHALKEGFEVVAFARNPEKINISNEKLKILKGELYEYEKIENCILGCDVVINALGVPMKFSYKDMSSLEGTLNIVKAMKKLKVNRLISWSTPSISSSEDVASLITTVPKIMAGLFLPKSKKELTLISKAILESNLDFTLVRFIAPKNSPFTGKIKTGFGDVKMSFSISREDIAFFMVKQVSDTSFIKRMPIIGS